MHPKAAAGVVGALVLVLRDTPLMPNALCRNRSDLFDSDDFDDIAAAKSLCRTCTELRSCRAWVASLRPQHRPGGVTAGRWRKPLG